MSDRFKFRAIVKGYYYIDKPDKCEEYEPSIFLENIDVLDMGDIGISEEDLEIAIRKQYPDLQNGYIERIMENFRDNSNGIDTYITITPEQIYQCTDLKDKNGKLIYEGDIVKFRNTDNKYYIGTIKYTDEDALFCLSYRNENNRDDWDYVSRYKLEVIGNIYENKSLLESEG